MIKNYFTTAWRTLSKNKFYSAINISGLAVGLAPVIMLLMWVENELNYDKFNKDYQSVYRLSSQMKSNGESRIWPVVPGPLAFLKAHSSPNTIQDILMKGVEKDKIKITIRKG